MKDKISIIIPVFNEEKNIFLLYNRITEVMNIEKYNYEILLVDDGSSDDSNSIMQNLHKSDKNVKIIKLKMNIYVY